MRSQIQLFSNVQFIYELLLAQLELRSLNATFEMSNDLRSFVLLHAKDRSLLRRRLAYFESVDGHKTDYSSVVQKNCTNSVNQYLTHWIYPYKGKFHPQMIRAALNICKLSPGDTVLDPFVGSGTTALEAQLLGIDFIGYDASPVCVMQSRVKTLSCDVLTQIKETYEALLTTGAQNIVSDKAFHDVVGSAPDRRVRDFFCLAKLVAISDSRRRRKDENQAFVSKTRLMIQSVAAYLEIQRHLRLSLGDVEIESGDARSLPLSDDSVSGIITSPPYSIALDYVKNDEHAFEALGYDAAQLREQFIGLRGRIGDRIGLYREDIKRSLDEMVRVLRPGGYAFIVIGNATFAGKEVKGDELVERYGCDSGLTLEKRVDKTIFGLYNVMQKEKILVFKKDNDLR
ncbi:MAG: site-specific DNA-methyltransferase [Euryarchaeota archaeon]|nr:site-specific DNA-methyltransferase [Euryarchaeota archaeon]